MTSGMGNLHHKSRNHYNILFKISDQFIQPQDPFARSIHIYNECVYEDPELLEERHKLKREEDKDFARYCLKKAEERKKIGLLQDLEQQLINTRIKKKKTSNYYF